MKTALLVRMILWVLLLFSACGEDSPTKPPIGASPELLSPAPGSWIDRLKVCIIGSADPGEAVVVLIDGTAPRETTYANQDGAFRIDDFVLGGQGGRVLWARMVEDSSLVSEPVPVHIDLAASETPVVLFPPHDSWLPAESAPIAGLATGDVSSVELFRDGTLIGTVQVEDGAFFLDAFQPTGQGEALIYARGVLETGGHTAFGESITVHVGSGQPKVVDEILSPSPGASLALTTVAFHGTVKENVSLAIFFNGGDIGLTTQASGGDFAFPPLSLPFEGAFVGGVVSYRAEAIIAEDAVVFTVDRTPPPSPVILRPANSELLRETSIVIEGVAEPYSLVYLLLDDARTDSLDASVTGAFSCSLETPGEGMFLLGTYAQDAAGNRSAPSEEIPFAVDLSAPTPPLLTSPEDGLLIVTSEMLISGSTDAGAWLEILLDGRISTAQEVPQTGIFELALETPRPDGSYTLSVRASSAPGCGWVRGNSSVFHVDLSPPAMPLIIQPPESSYVTGNDVCLAGAAEPMAQVVVLKDTTLTEVYADHGGSWTATISIAGDDGPCAMKAFQVDSAGHQSETSQDHVLIIDRIAPPLEILAPSSGTLLNANPIAISGETEPGARVWIDGGEIDPEQDGAFQSMVFLAEGHDTVIVQAQDSAGNRNLLSLPLELDTTPPFIIINSPVDSLITQQTSITVSGSTEPGSIVMIQGANVAVDVNGAFYAPVGLIHGWNSIEIQATDRAGWEASLVRLVASDRIPGQPGNPDPDDSELVNMGKPLLSVRKALDLDADELTYTFEIHGESTMTSLVAQSHSIVPAGRDVTWTVAPELPLDGASFFWRARAWDGIVLGPWSQTATFRVPDIGSRDPHELFGWGDSITAGAQGILTDDGKIWVWMSAGYIEELELGLSVFFADEVEVDYAFVSGGSSSDGVEQMDENLQGVNAGYLLLLFGTIDANDGENFNAAESVTNLRQMVQDARSEGMVVILGTIPPRIPPEQCGQDWSDPDVNNRVIILNQAITELAEEDSIPLADHYTVMYETAFTMPLLPGETNYLFNVLSRDGIHPNGVGYSIMAREWYKTITGSDEIPAVLDLLPQWGRCVEKETHVDAPEERLSPDFSLAFVARQKKGLWPQPTTPLRDESR